MANPGDKVFEIGKITLAPDAKSAFVEARIGVVDKSGNAQVMTKTVRVALDPALYASTQQALRAAVLADPSLQGAVPM